MFPVSWHSLESCDHEGRTCLPMDLRSLFSMSGLHASCQLLHAGFYSSQPVFSHFTDDLTSYASLEYLHGPSALHYSCECNLFLSLLCSIKHYCTRSPCALFSLYVFTVSSVPLPDGAAGSCALAGYNPLLGGFLDCNIDSMDSECSKLGVT